MELDPISDATELVPDSGSADATPAALARPGAVDEWPAGGRIEALLNSTSLLSTTALMAAIEPKALQLSE